MVGCDVRLKFHDWRITERKWKKGYENVNIWITTEICSRMNYPIKFDDIALFWSKGWRETTSTSFSITKSHNIVKCHYFYTTKLILFFYFIYEYIYIYSRLKKNQFCCVKIIHIYIYIYYIYIVTNSVRPACDRPLPLMATVNRPPARTILS